MNRHRIKSVRADVDGWQVIAWDIAKTKRPFQIKGWREQNMTFLKELSCAYEYQLKYFPGKVSFIPLTPSLSNPQTNRINL